MTSDNGVSRTALSRTRGELAEHLGQPVIALVTLALTADGELWAEYPQADDPRHTVALLAKGQGLFGCPDNCDGCSTH